MYRWEPGGGGVCHRHHLPLCAPLPPQTNSLSVANLKRFLLLYLTWYRSFCSFIFWNKNIKTHAYSRFLNGHTSYSEILKVRFLTTWMDAWNSAYLFLSPALSNDWLGWTGKRTLGHGTKLIIEWGNLQNRKNIFWRDFR